MTFDQPFCFKSMETVKSESLPIVCRLSGFHTSMSFLGSIGKLMDGSGWKMVLETIYGEKIVENITTGKVISRAIRGHFIVDAALHTALIAQVFPGCVLDNENNSEDPNNTNILFKELSQYMIIYFQVNLHDMKKAEEKLLLSLVRWLKAINVIHNIHV